jgi:hypothetical protein
MPELFYFGRREDLRRPATPRESPLREFELRCHHCQTCSIKIRAEYDKDAGAFGMLSCQRCRNVERVGADSRTC